MAADDTQAWVVGTEDADLLALALFDAGADAVVQEPADDGRVRVLAAVSDSSAIDARWGRSVRVRSDSWSAPASEVWAGGFRVVNSRPDVTLPMPKGEVIALVADRSFGSGSHATTVLCLDELRVVIDQAKRARRLDDPPISVLDVGTGSGILAIAAGRLGARPIYTCEIDEDSRRTADRNAGRNGVELEWVEALPGEGSVDVVVANMLTAELAPLAKSVRESVAPSGTLIVSGCLTDGVDDVLRLFDTAGDTANDMAGERPIRVSTRDGWACITFGPAARSD